MQFKVTKLTIKQKNVQENYVLPAKKAVLIFQFHEVAVL